MTLGSLSVALGLAQVITGGIDVRSVPEALTDFNTYIKILGIPSLPFVALITLLIGGIVLHKTKFGRYTYADRLKRAQRPAGRHQGRPAPDPRVRPLGPDGRPRRRPGARPVRTTTIAGQSLTNLNVIAAVVIGGTSIFGGEGSIFGTVVGLFIPAVLQAGFVIIGVEAFWQGVAVGIVLVAAVFVDQSRRAAALRGAKPQPDPRHPPTDQVKGPHEEQRLLRTAGVAVVALPLAACTSSKPARPRSGHGRRRFVGRGQRSSGHLDQRAAEGQEELQHRVHPGRGGRPVLHHHAVRRPGRSGQAGRHGQDAGPAEVRPHPAEADPRLRRGQQARRDHDRADRRDGHAGPPAGRGRAGIKIILVDTTTKDPSYAASAIASDNEAGGKAAFEAIKALNPNGGKVMMMSVDPGISTTDARAKGFEDAVKADSKFQYVGIQYSHDDPATASNLMGSSLQKNPDIVGVFATNLFAAEGSANGVRQAGKTDTVKIVSFDAGPNQVKDLNAGTIQALVAQQPGTIGQYGVDKAVAALDGGTVTPKIQTGSTVITKDNINGAGGEAVYKSSC